MEIAEIKEKLRKIKRLEYKIRYGDVKIERPFLVWDAFFDLREKNGGRAKYTLGRLLIMSREEYKSAVGEYWAFVYLELFGDDDLHTTRVRDAAILLKWGLPPDAGSAEVKKRFRELAKLYHPDTGGDDESFIELMSEYKKLTGK